MAAVDFLASRGMGEPGSPRGLPRGVESPGEESRSVRRCVSGDRGAAILRPDQAMERPCGPHADQHPREKTWRTSNVLHKRPGFPGEEKETLAFRKDNVTSRQSVQTATLPMERVSVGLEALANPSAQTKALAFPVTRTNPRSPHRNSTSSTMRTTQVHPSRVAPASGNDAGPPVPRRSTYGGTNSDMRAQAVPPTRTAPTIAKASRQNSDGTPIWASPNVAWYPAMAAGTANRSAIAARMSGVRTVAKASCPIARVAPPTRTPTTRAPMTPEPLWKAASPAVRPAKTAARRPRA